jgi:hypothetical protein
VKAVKSPEAVLARTPRLTLAARRLTFESNVAKLRLPSRASESWSGGLVLDRAFDARAVDARHGVVLAGGDRLVLLRAGETTLATREPPAGIGSVRTVAVEPRRRARIAAGGEAGLALFDDDGVSTMRVPPGGPVPERIAWGRGPGGGFALYVAHEDGSLLRVRPETGEVEEMPIGAVVALASDENGTLAVASIDADAPGVGVTHDGEHWHWRPLSELDGMGGWELAVAGDAAALGIAYRGVWISRGLEEPFARCEAFEEGGPLAFEGATSDAAVFGAVHVGWTETIVRVDAAGRAVRITEIEPGVEGDRPEPRLSALAWDASRRTLWGAMPGVGVMKSEAPADPGKARTMLS